MRTSTAIKYAIKRTIPVMCGYIFMGIAFGLLLQQAGYNFIWAFVISLCIYAGSMQFVLVSFLYGGVSLITIALMTLLINGRHIFYGISFIERFKKMGKKYPYMIFSLTDETYSLLCSLRANEPELRAEAALPEAREDKVLFLIALFDQSYWIIGCTLGAFIGQGLAFDYTGIDFSMTALFVVLFIEQWLDARGVKKQADAKADVNGEANIDTNGKREKKFPHLPAIVGLLSATAFLLLLGPDQFLLPSLVCTVLILLLLRNAIGASDHGEVHEL
ncbi:MAG TPA: AzlC family ABC transporter permease [Lachnospiraceae bacterium]|nr:AzlC family ABC transporter permease [Lachnospiraceae bacterium]